MHILIIDDDYEDVEFFIDAVTTLVKDCQCTVARSGDEAFIKLAVQPHVPSHIFLDGMLYGMTSRDCLMKLKSHPEWQASKVIVYTGYIHPQARNEFIALGAELLIQKPTSREDLISALKEIIG
jgi:CheY-like chemotaxis protein